MPVRQLIGATVVLTVVVTLIALLVSCLAVLPVSIYVAMKPYSIGARICRMFSFINRCLPSFLFALLFAYVASTLFKVNLYWSTSIYVWWGMAAGTEKNFDFVRYLWTPVIVLGLRYIACLVYKTQASLLDELRKPYVMAAKAKGLSGIKLLEHLAPEMLSVLIKDVKRTLPNFVSDVVIISVVFSWPMMGPIFLFAVRYPSDMFTVAHCSCF